MILKKTYLYVFTLFSFCVSFMSYSQGVRVIDNKGTINTVLNVGDIKYGVQTANHNGWYLLNGQPISSLSATAQAAAGSLSLSGNLPNAVDRVLKHPNATQAMFSTGGNANTTLSQANLPNVNFTGTTNTTGGHSHNLIGYSSRTERIYHGWNSYRDYVTTAGGGSTMSTSYAGNHSHTVTVNSGGSGTSFENYQPYLVVNTFIYLGL